MKKGMAKSGGSGLEKIIDPDPVCSERLDPDPVNIRPDSKPWPVHFLTGPESGINIFHSFRKNTFPCLLLNQIWITADRELPVENPCVHI